MSENVINWAKEMKGQGIKLYILSNTNNQEKVKTVAKKLNIKYKHFAMKPLKKGFKYVQKETNMKPENIAVVGDQIFTDVLGGNRCNMFTILVDPIDDKKDTPRICCDSSLPLTVILPVQDLLGLPG